MAFQFKTTVSYTCYEVLTAPGPDVQEAVLDGLIRGRIPRIDVDVGHDRAAGFAVFADPLDIDFSPDKVFAGPVILFSFRQDRLAIPASTLRLYVEQRCRQNMAATHRDRLPRQERDELREAVRTDLLRRVPPTIHAYEVIWDQDSSRLRLFATSPAVCDDFVARAREGLGLQLRPLNTVGVIESGLDDRQVNEAFHLLPSTFLAGGEAPDDDSSGRS